jgi:hypothetical protein
MNLLSASACVCLAALTAGCSVTMNDAYGRSRLLETTQTASLANKPLKDYPMSAATLARARSEKAPILCDARGPVDQTAKAVLDRVGAVAAELVKGTNPCAQGESGAQAGTNSGASACVNSTTPETDTSTLAVTCDPGKIIIAMDGGTFQLEQLHGKIYSFQDSETLTLLGWETGKTRLVVIRTGLDHKKGKDRFSGSFLAIESPERVKTARELIPTIYNLDMWELFALDASGTSGIVVRAPRDTLSGPAELEAAAFHVE